MKVLVFTRDPGESYWYKSVEGEVIAETISSYKVKVNFCTAYWYNKDGPYYRCETIKEVKNV